MTSMTRLFLQYVVTGAKNFISMVTSLLKPSGTLKVSRKCSTGNCLPFVSKVNCSSGMQQWGQDDEVQQEGKVMRYSNTNRS